MMFSSFFFFKCLLPCVAILNECCEDHMLNELMPVCLQIFAKKEQKM